MINLMNWTNSYHHLHNKLYRIVQERGDSTGTPQKKKENKAKMKRKTKKRKGNYLKMLGELKHLPASKCKKLCVEIFPPGPPIFPLLFTPVRIVPADAHNDLKIYIQWIGPIPHVYEVYFLNTNILLKFRFFFLQILFHLVIFTSIF